MSNEYVYSTTRFVDERGSSRFDLFPTAPFEGQINFAKLDKGVVKAFHKHSQQKDYFTCISGKILVILWTPGEIGNKGVYERFVISSENPEVVIIPPFVYHGFKALDDDTQMLYYTTRKFNPEAPDEFRENWDYFGKDVWDVEFF